MSWRAKWLWIGVLLTIAVLFGVFWLPFLLPPAPAQIVSASNAAAFNNHVAVFAAGIVGLAAMILFEWVPCPFRLADETDRRPLPLSYFVGGALAVGALSSMLLAMVYPTNAPYYRDYRYFIAPITKLALDHRRLYTQVHVSYGPLMFYPPVWMRGLFSSCRRPIAAAYSVVYVAHQVGGLLLLGYILQVLPIRTSLRRALFLLMAFFTLSPALGINYTLFRFVAPLAMFMFSVRGRRLGAMLPLLLLGQMFSLGISPEMGLSFGCGTIAYALFRCLHDRRGWIALCALPIAGAAIFLVLVGRDYLHMLSMFAGGGDNMVIEPQPHVLVYLLALVWLCPVALVAARRSQQADAAMLYGAYGLGLGLLPVAFGRTDPGHVIFNALPILLLALIAVSSWGPVGRHSWISVLFVGVLFYQWTNVVLYAGQAAGLPALRPLTRVALRLRSALYPRSARPESEVLAKSDESPSEADMDKLQGIVGHARIFAPYGLSLAMEEHLRQRRLFQPGTYFDLRDVMNPPAEQGHITEMEAQAWALVPASGPTFVSESPESTQFVMGIPLPYHSKRPAYVTGVLMDRELHTHWHAVANIHDSLLYRRNW